MSNNLDESVVSDYVNFGNGELVGQTSFLDKIHQQEMIERQQRVKTVLRKGIAPPTAEELESILERRAKFTSTKKLQKHIEDTERRQAEWRDYVTCKPHIRELATPLQVKVETTGLEGRAVILSPLLALFRMLLCDNRAKRRLTKLRTRKSAQVSDTSALNSRQEGLLEAVSVVEEHMSVAPAHSNRLAPMPNLFLMTSSFEVKPLRNPFVFLSREYQMERLPEFALNLSKAASKEYATYTKADYSEPTAVILSDFVQPFVMLETFDVTKRAHDTVHRENLVLGYESFSTVPTTQSTFIAGGKMEVMRGTDSTTGNNLLPEESSYAGLPLKLNGPLADDSMSESDTDDVSVVYNADISWLPQIPLQRVGNGKEPQKPLDGTPS
ncbi:uncharacterized protein TM35_000212880 [Trypanosoma theileri]|uniref:Uncharacterized protein n=1 Tax=Trypanosoma theileri TaxID=67003 RepID=A0A1X0NSK6_9TRYP|nr:uncharacterized protein TM35_000212880 [Trypanosoma theileri]ORC87682.1 hypothetical protein TM35_000212880 [Trypanosoma theileri]